ncbi:MAG: HAD-IIA family hydrolase [Candidatus Promineifilaceae bacterium]
MTIKHLILDMDGVLWRGNMPMPGLVDFFDTLDRLGISVALATNNASKTAVMYTKKLANFGVEIDASRIVTSAEATAAYLSEQYDQGTAVYLVGDKGLHDAFTHHGFRILTTDDVLAGQTASVVVAGFYRGVTYDLMAGAAILINKGARFVGTNPDVTYPSEYGRLPGAGAILAFIEASTGQSPEIIGKPMPTMFNIATKRLGGTPETTAMVGDRLNTDIAGGQAAGLKTILVFSGITQPEDLATSNIQPTYTFANITELAHALANGGLT